jgi:hypothetical protein
MKAAHIELIDPKEKIPVEWGGYGGYVGPRGVASPLALYVNALASAERWPDLNATVWKVLRSSVNWKSSASTRRLVVAGRTIPCEVIGGVRDWWFVSVDAKKTAAILEPVAKD